jgi:hypothetical protein
MFMAEAKPVGKNMQTLCFQPKKKEGRKANFSE